MQSSIRFPKDSLSSPLVTTAKKEITTAKKPDEETLIGAQQSAKEVELLQKKFWRYCAVVDLFCANRIPFQFKKNSEAKLVSPNTTGKLSQDVSRPHHHAASQKWRSPLPVNDYTIAAVVEA